MISLNSLFYMYSLRIDGNWLISISCGTLKLEVGCSSNLFERELFISHHQHWEYYTFFLASMNEANPAHVQRAYKANICSWRHMVLYFVDFSSASKKEMPKLLLLSLMPRRMAWTPVGPSSIPFLTHLWVCRENVPLKVEFAALRDKCSQLEARNSQLEAVNRSCSQR